MKLRNAVIAAVVLIVAAITWATRFQTTSTNYGTMYLVNRWTGSITFVTPYGSHLVEATKPQEVAVPTSSGSGGTCDEECVKELFGDIKPATRTKPAKVARPNK